MNKEKESIIIAAGIVKKYGRQTVLQGIDLRIERGSVFALLGPNGAGKTTMVRILATLLRPDGGTVVVAGHDVAAEPNAVRAAIGLTGQYAAVDEMLTGRENLVMVGELCGLRRTNALARAQALLVQFDLQASADKLAKTYSGGMRRKLDLAMSLVGSPQVIFLDEPTTGLDPRSRKIMWDMISSLAAGGTTIFLTTQYLEEADQLADRVAVIDGGKVVAEGTPAELKRRVGDQYIEISFERPADLAMAYDLFERKLVTKFPETNSLRIVSDGGVAATKKALDVLHARRLTAATVALKQPSLDDVFFALTGKAAKQEQADDK